MPFRHALIKPGIALILACGMQAQDPTTSPRSSGSANQQKKTDPDQIGNRDVSQGVNFYSIEKEMALGKALADQVMLRSEIVDDPVISEYVNRVGQNLARNSDSRFSLMIRVIRSQEINALSLPGGYFFVNTGLLLTADSESELAGAMAHEIAHIAARHATRQATRDRIGGMAAIPLIFMGGLPGVGARAGAEAVSPLAGAAFSRAFESEADLLGLEYMYKAGYDPNGFVNIFEKIQALDNRRPGAVSRLFASHPPTGTRIESVQKNIQNLLKPQPQYVVNTSEFDAAKARLETLENAPKSRPPDRDKPSRRTRPDVHLSE